MVNGYCWSSNAFLDGTKSGRNASRFIAELKNAGFVSIENERSKSRKIRICRVDSKVNPANSGEVEKAENANPANSGEVDEFEKTNPANFGEVEKPENGNPANSGEVEKAENANPANSGEVEEFENANLANSGDRTSSSSLNIYKKTTTTASGQRKFDREAPYSPDYLKNALSAVDGKLILRKDFYPKAASFMSKNNLDENYLAWIYSQCEIKNPDSFDGYYFTLFFAENMVEKYQIIRLSESKQPPLSKPPPSVICEACGEAHARSDAKCPSCGLPEYPRPDEIPFYRKLHEFPPEKRKEYLKKQTAVYEECGYNFEKLKTALAALKQEYGL